MKVVFWSGVGETATITYAMTAVGILLRLLYGCEVVLCSNHISNITLQDCFLCKSREQGVLFDKFQLNYGSSDYDRRLWELKKKRPGHVMEVPMDGITILYPPDITEEKMFYFEVPDQTMYLLNIAGKLLTVSEKALQEADLIVVCLPPEEDIIQMFFEQYSTLHSKSIFVFYEYRKKNKVSLRAVETKYKINRWKLGRIPHDNEYVIACEEGKLESFLRDNLSCSTKNPHFYIMSGLLQLTKRLYSCSCEQNKKWKKKGGES